MKEVNLYKDNKKVEESVCEYIENNNLEYEINCVIKENGTYKGKFSPVMEIQYNKSVPYPF